MRLFETPRLIGPDGKGCWPRVRLTPEGYAAAEKAWLAKAPTTTTTPSPNIQPVGHTVMDLCALAGVSNGTLAKYAELANVARPGRGQRNHRYTPEEAQRIFQVMYDQPSGPGFKQKARQALDKLQENHK